MPAPLTRRSTWPDRRLALLLLLIALLASLPGKAAAQDGDRLRLRPSIELAPPQNAPAPAAPDESAVETLRLKTDSTLRTVGVQAPRAPARSSLGVTEAFLQADVNLQGLDDSVLVLKREDGAVLVAGEDIDRWRLRRPEGPPLEREGKLYYLLSDIPGLTADLDETRQSLSITVPPEAFSGTSEAVAARNFPPPVLPRPGAFFNYTLSATQSTDTSIQNGLFEAGFFSAHGVLTSSVVSEDLTDSKAWVRLDTTYAIDFPADMTSVRLGDTVTRPGAWGRSVRIGGAQWSTNFATQPGFIRSPVLQAGGSAALPSVVDVYVNNALVQRSNVPPGPFSISNIPIVTGSGQVQVVVRDLLGRQQVITQPFYSSATLLREGVSDWSYEAGSIRNNFGLESNDYGQAAGVATYRRGWTDWFTAEAHAEAARNVRALGASSALRAGNFAVLSATLAASQSEQAGSGQLVGLGVEALSSTLSVAAQTFFTTPEFRQLGMEEDELPRKRQSFGTVTYAMGERGSLSAAFTRQEFRDQPQIQTTSLTYSVPVRKNASFSLSLLKTTGATESTTAFATLTIPFGELTTGSISYDRTRDSSTGAVQSNTTLVGQKSLPVGDGYGYRVQLRNEDFLATGSLQNRVGTYTLEASQPRDGDAAYRVTATGGVGLVGGHAFLSRTLTDSFGVVRVADFPDVKVLQDNQLVARTDDSGYAILPRLRPYDRNQVTLDHNDLPFDATLGRLRLDAVPYYRSGVLLDFPVKRVRAATLHVLLEDGTPLPSGALARFEGGSSEFPVALRGEAYLEGFEEKNRIVFTWRGQSCTLDVPYPKSSDPLPELGTFVCKGVLP